jgi:cytochrome P450
MWWTIVACWVTAFAVVYSLWFAYFAWLKRQGHGEPLVGAWIPFFGAAIPFGANMLGYLSACQRTHGDTFAMVMLGKKFHVVTSPLDHDTVLLERSCLDPDAPRIKTLANAASMTADKAAVLRDDSLRVLVGAHLSSAQAQHRNNELALREVFARVVGSSAFPAAATIQLTRDKWATLNLSEFVGKLMFRVGSAVVFGEGMDSEDLWMSFNVLDAGYPALASGMPPGMLQDCITGRDVIASSIGRLWETAPEKMGPWIAARMRHFLAKGLSLHEASRVNAITFWATHANSVNLAFWMLARILDDAAVRREVQREADSIFGSLQHFQAPERLAAELDKLQWTTAVMHETLRLTVSPLSAREVTTDATIPIRCPFSSAAPSRSTNENLGTLYVKRGDQVIVPALHHLDPNIFESPHTFRPSRFVLPDGQGDGASDRNKPRFFKDGCPLTSPVFAFGGGATECPGQMLASVQVRLLVLVLLHELEFEYVHGQGLPLLNETRGGFGVAPPAKSPDVKIRRR